MVDSGIAVLVLFPCAIRYSCLKVPASFLPHRLHPVYMFLALVARKNVWKIFIQLFPFSYRLLPILFLE